MSALQPSRHFCARLTYIYTYTPPALCLARRGCALVFLNGNILGVHRRPKYFVRSFREMRRRGRVGEFVSVYMQHDTVQIASDGGRVCRPLIICDRGVPRVKDEHLQVGRGGARIGRGMHANENWWFVHRM